MMTNPPMELDWIRRWAMYSPRAVALKDGDTGRELTYAQLYEEALRGAQILRSSGLRRGDRIAVVSTNELEYVSLFFAAQRIGAILVPVNFRLTAGEIEHILKDSEASALFFHPEFAETIEAIPAPSLPRFTKALIGPSSYSRELLSAEYAPASFEATPEDPCMIIYTSGTTGAPKGAVLSHSMLFWNSVNTTLRLNVSQNDCAVIFLPLFHTGGWNVLTTPFLHRGAKIVLLKKFNAERILRLTAEEDATLLFGVPTTMDMLVRDPGFKDADLSRVRYAIVGGEPMPPDLIETWHKKGIPIRQGYGLTEFGPNVFSLNEEDAIRKIGSIGFPNFYVEARVVDDIGKDLSRGDVGELVLRGPVAMSGYWRNERATSETIRDGWLHTGDLVRQDDEGYFYVVGRKKDMYKSGGENVYPAEIERVLRSHPKVKEAAVIGVPDEKWGEVGHAFVVLESPGLTADELSGFCSAHLAKFKIPRRFSFPDELPKGDSGKILKRALRELIDPN